MPTVHNGVGTWYYGKKNVQTRPGACEFCRRQGTLKSYDTRLYFVFLMIPIIPLSKKHIIDECPSCKRHRVSALGDWQKNKEKAIQDGLKKMEATPGDPEAAMALHKTYLYFGERAEGEKLLAFMLEQHAQNEKVQMYVGWALQYIGKSDQAAICFEKALQLNPESPEARRAVGVGLIGKGKVDEAHQLLKYMEQPGGGIAHAQVLNFLANAYQAKGRHEEALKLYRLVLERAPAWAQDKTFRKAVATSEKALNSSGAVQSLLPPRKRNLKWVKWTGAAAALLFAGLCGSEYYVSQHRTVHVISATPVTVQISGIGAVQADGYGKTIELTEGTHHVIVGVPFKSEFDIQVTGSVFSRLFGSEVQVINAGGSALLIWEQVVYSADNTGLPGAFVYHFGQNFEVLSDIDYPFQIFPSTIKVEHSHNETRTRLGLASVEPEAAEMGLINVSRWGEAMQMGEWYLRLHPENRQMLRIYFYAVQRAGAQQRYAAFLREMCAHRPIEIEWHRAYQNLGMSSAEIAKLVTEYDKLLAAEPHNSVLLYLRGRLCGSVRESTGYFERAIESDPKNAYAYYGMAYNHSGRGEWDDAIKDISTALALRPADNDFADALLYAQFSGGKYVELETSLRAFLAKNDENLAKNMLLADVLIAQKKTEEARKLWNQYSKNYSVKLQDLCQRFIAHFMYAAAEFSALELSSRVIAGAKDQTVRYESFEALVELNRLKEAAQVVPPNEPTLNDPFFMLICGVAWRHGGDETVARQWRDRAVGILKAGKPAEAKAAELLSRGEAPAVDEALDISLEIEQKVILLTALAQQFPARGEEYAVYARRLNTTLNFPHYLVERVLGAKTSEPGK